MAVHLVSLQWLQPGANRPAQSRPVDAAAASAEVQFSEVHADGLENIEIPAEALAAGLGLSHADVEALVQRSGADVGKALLALIARISALESELGGLRSRIEVARPSASRPQGPRPEAPGRGPSRSAPMATGRSALLEQVFQNNLELWKSIEEEEESPGRRKQRSRRSRET